MDSSDPVQKSYDKLVSDNTTDIVPLPPAADKTQGIKRQTLGGKDGVQTKAQYITREALGAYRRQTDNSQPTTSLFRELVTSAYNFLKAKFTRKPSAPAPKLEISSPTNVKVLNAEAHLKLANKQLASLTHNLNHPDQKQIKLDPNYPRAVIPLKDFIHTLESAIQSEKAKTKESKIQALADFGEEEAYAYDKANTHEDQSFNQLTNVLANELVTHQEIEDLSASIKELENTLKFLDNSLNTGIKNLESDKILNTPRNHELLTKRYNRLAEPLVMKIAIATAELDNLKESRSPLTKGMLKDAEGLQEIATSWKEESNSLDQFKEEVQTLHDANNHSKLMEMKKTREHEITEFNEVISEQTASIAHITVQLDEMERELTGNWLEDGTLHEKIDLGTELTAQKAELEQHILSNKEVLQDITDELGILKAISQTPSMSALRDLNVGASELYTGKTDFLPTGTPDDAARLQNLQSQINSLSKQIESHTHQINEAYSSGDIEKAIDLGLEKDTYIEEQTSLNAQLTELKEATKDHTVDGHVLAEQARIQKHKLETEIKRKLENVNKKIADLDAQMKNPALPNAFGQNALKMREYRNQRNELQAELTKVYNLSDTEPVETLAEVEPEMEVILDIPEDSKIGELETAIRIKKELIEEFGEDDVELAELKDLETQLANLKKPSSEKPEEIRIDTSDIEEQERLRKQDQLLSDKANNLILEEDFSGAFKEVIQINDVEMRKFYTIEVMDNLLAMDKDAVHVRHQFNLLDMAMRQGISMALSMPDEDLKEKYLAQIGKHFLAKGNVKDAEETVASIKDGAAKENLLSQTKKLKAEQELREQLEKRNIKRT